MNIAAITAIAETLRDARDAAMTEAQREARAKAEAAKADRIAKMEMNSPALAARNAILGALKKSVAQDVQSAALNGASPRMEMRLLANHSKEAAAMLGVLGESSNAEYFAMQGDLADDLDMRASSLGFLRNVPVLRGLARTNVGRLDALVHEQTKLIGTINRSGEELTKALFALSQKATGE